MSMVNAENAKWLVGTLAIPLTLGVLAHEYQSMEADRQITDSRLRLYTELLSKREAADTDVRRGVFDKVLEKYLTPTDQTLQPKLVALDLLAANFHDTLDLSPLFWQLFREVKHAPGGQRSELYHQLVRIADGVKDRQIAALELGGSMAVAPSNEAPVQLNHLKSIDAVPNIDTDLSFSDPDPQAPIGQVLKRHFRLWVVDHDAPRRRVYAVVQATPNSNEKSLFWQFWVDTFDFPMVTFIRISRTERFAVALREYDASPHGEATARVSLIYFPSARVGSKDKPFIDDVIGDLVHERKQR